MDRRTQRRVELSAVAALGLGALGAAAVVLPPRDEAPARRPRRVALAPIHPVPAPRTLAPVSHDPSPARSEPTAPPAAPLLGSNRDAPAPPATPPLGSGDVSGSPSGLGDAPAPPAPSVSDLLHGALTDPDPVVARGAVIALQQLGLEGRVPVEVVRAALLELAARLQEPDGRALALAGLPLDGISPREAERLASFLDDPHLQVREASARALDDLAALSTIVWKEG